MPVSRLTGSYNISSAITKLVNSPAVKAPLLILNRAYVSKPTMVIAAKNSIIGEESACWAT